MPREYKRREFFAILRKNGYKEIRTKGSHHIFKNDCGDEIVINKDPNGVVCARLIKEHNLKV